MTYAGVIAYPDEIADSYRAAGAWSDRSLPTAFRATVAQHRDRLALITSLGSLTYGELDERSDAVAAGLLQAGLEPGARVILQLTNSKTAVVAWYGLLKAGLIPVCTLAIHRRHEISEIARQTGAVAHLVQADLPKFDLVAFAAEIRSLVPSVRTLLTVGGSADGPGLRIEDLASRPVSVEQRASLVAAATALDPCAPAVYQLSGGTTGTPKVIPRLHAEYWYNATATARWWGHDHTSVLAFGLPLVHNAALSNGLHAAHSAGAALLLATPAADALLPLMAEHRATWVMSPPGLAREYLDHPGFDAAVSRLRTWVLTAARVPRSVFDGLERRGVHVTQAFGMSEGLFLFTPSGAPADLRATTVGAPISPLDEVRVLRPGTDEEVARGETGELAARGPYTIRGYLDAQDRNRETFTADGFYRSGDLVRAHEHDGVVLYSIEGRVKDLIDRGGEKINAEEVETLIAQHEAVREAALVGMPDARLGERGCVFVVPQDPARPPALTDVRAHLERLGMAKYKWPERVEIVESLPRTQIGKVAKVRLREDIAKKIANETGSAGAAH
ncbi:AMP-binding protein [Amycolatopsis rhabdoformis]|uniref:AMP-binding protein n=1 Tax=Amycolatopsis rhabdoformis TaxID=1448059 RepID=A0ABZ1IMG0_9PSEU|nr:AMP-binding protein [Amycolatopsis rhabdoformis]WSE34729.1 AMP-binding protein [Amycolatopsis rhabdoformis]